MLLSHIHLSCKLPTLGNQRDKNQYDLKCDLETLGCMLLNAHKSMHNAKMHKMSGKKILAKKVSQGYVISVYKANTTADLTKYAVFAYNFFHMHKPSELQKKYQ